MTEPGDDRDNDCHCHDVIRVLPSGSPRSSNTSLVPVSVPCGHTGLSVDPPHLSRFCWKKGLRETGTGEWGHSLLVLELMAATVTWLGMVTIRTQLPQSENRRSLVSLRSGKLLDKACCWTSWHLNSCLNVSLKTLWLARSHSVLLNSLDPDSQPRGTLDASGFGYSSLRSGLHSFRLWNLMIKSNKIIKDSNLL